MYVYNSVCWFSLTPYASVVMLETFPSMSGSFRSFSKYLLFAAILINSLRRCSTCSLSAGDFENRTPRLEGSSPLSARGMSSPGSAGKESRELVDSLPPLLLLLLVWISTKDSGSGSSIRWKVEFSTPSRMFSTVHSTDLVILRSSTIWFRGKCGNSCCTCLIIASICELLSRPSLRGGDTAREKRGSQATYLDPSKWKK